MKTKTALLLIDVQRGLIEGFQDDWNQAARRRVDAAKVQHVPTIDLTRPRYRVVR